MFILTDLGGILRGLAATFDGIVFGFIDDAYNLIQIFASNEIFTSDAVETIMNSTYMIIGLFALFKIALLLINAVISPDKLFEKEGGLTSIVKNLIIMILLLVVTPALFSEAFKVQNVIVKGNYVYKIFGIDVPDNTDFNSFNPGQQFKRIAVGALIYPDEEFANYEDGVWKANCSGKCEDAVDNYNEALSSPKKIFTIINDNIGVKEKDSDGNEKYVYNYRVPLTLLVGIAITYILFSFVIDIALRSIELSVLEIVSPLFIVTYIDPKSVKSGPFSKWLKTTLQTFASLFIKLAILALMLVFVSLLANKENTAILQFSSSAGPITELTIRLIIILAILIFAKKAPGWIAGMVGIDEKSLNSGGFFKKLGSAALVGGALTKAGNAIAGAGLGAVKTAHAARKAHKNNLEQDGERARTKVYNGVKSANGLSGKAKALGSGIKQSYFTKDAISSNMKNFAKTAGIGAIGIGQGIVSGLKAGASGSNFKDINAKTTADAKVKVSEMSPSYKSKLSSVGENISSALSSGMTKLDGDSFKKADRIKESEGVQTAKERYGKVYYDSNGKRDTLLNPIKTSELNNLVSNLKTAGFNIDSSSKASVSGALVQKRIDAGIIKNAKVSDDGRKVEVKDSAGNITHYDSVKFCEQNGIYDKYGEQELELMTKDVAYTNGTNYVNNSNNIAKYNEAAASANNQIMSFQANVKSTLGTDAFNVIKSLDQSLRSKTKIETELADARSKHDSVKESQMLHNLTAVENTISKIKTIVDQKIGVGTSASYEAATKTREDCVASATRLIKENENIKNIVIDSIGIEGNDSSYHVTDKVTNESFDFLSDPNKNEYAINLLAKARDAAKSDAEKLKPKKDGNK